MLVACPTNFTYVPSVPGCYKVVVDKLRQAAASYRCITLHPDAHLVAITSAAEQTVVAGMLAQHRCEYSSRLALVNSKRMLLTLTTVIML